MPYSSLCQLNHVNIIIVGQTLSVLKYWCDILTGEIQELRQAAQLAKEAQHQAEKKEQEATMKLNILQSYFQEKELEMQKYCIFTKHILFMYFMWLLH